MYRILYIGDSQINSTSGHRINAIRRLGNKVDVCDPYMKFRRQLRTKLEALHYRTGFILIQGSVNIWIKQIVNSIPKPDLVWVNSGEWLGPKSLKILKKLDRPIVLYNNDDPTGGRDGRKFSSLLASLPYYDLCAVMREVNISEFKVKGARNVVRVFMSYDEEIHRPFSEVSDIPAIFQSEVAFVGTWMRYEKRDEFLLELKKQGIPLSIWGNRWNKSKHWQALKSSYKGGSLSGRDYVAAIQGAKICLGLLSKGNRDLHTQRSLEVPFAGGLLCAERTTEHQEMFKEGVEAVFWSDADECAKVCKELLNNDTLRESIRAAGILRVKALNIGNENVCQRILDQLNIN